MHILWGEKGHKKFECSKFKNGEKHNITQNGTKKKPNNNNAEKLMCTCVASATRKIIQMM